MSRLRMPPTPPRGRQRSEAADDPRGSPLYQMIVKTLKSEIVRGVFPVGTQLPSEAALVARFGVSRHTVRQALRALREAGLVRPHQGLGTLVEGLGTQHGYVHQINQISDLFPLNVSTRYETVHGSLIRLPEWARFTPELTGRERTWLHVRGYRSRDPAEDPFNELDVFVAARFAGVGRVLGSQRSIYATVEMIYGETIAEVEQFIGGFRADAERGASLGLKPGDAGIEIRRIFRIASDNGVAMVSINRYRPDDFTFNMTLRRARDGG
jgi:DNA-binding GntR family transcriptional regulator